MKLGEFLKMSYEQRQAMYTVKAQKCCGCGAVLGVVNGHMQTGKGIVCEDCY